MSLTVQKFPNFVLADSPTEIVFIKRGIVTNSTGGFARLFLVLDENDPPTAAETLVLLQDTAAYLTFTFGSGTTASDLPPFTGGSFYDYAVILAAELYRNPTLKRDYKVEFLSHDVVNEKAVIVFTARERGSAYNLTIDPDPATTLDYVVADTLADTVVDDTVLENYKVKVSLDLILDQQFDARVERVDNIEATGVVDYEKEEMKITVHELPALSKSNLAHDIPFNAWRVLPYRESQGELRMEAHEEYTNSNTKALIQETEDLEEGNPSMAIFLGGLPLRKLQFFDYFVNQTLNRFFSMWPGRSKVTSKTHAEWLSSVAAIGDTDIEFTVYYSNGTSESKTVTYSTEVLHLIYIPTGFDQNFLDDLDEDGRTPIRWTVKQTGGIDYEEYEYIIDTRLHWTEERCFLFLNGLAMFETLRCVGVNEYTIKTKGENKIHTRHEETEEARGTIEMVYNEREEMWTMRTGWLLSKEDKEYLTDFISSKYVAEIILPLYEPLDLVEDEVVTGTVYYKERIRGMVIIPGTFKFWEEDENKWALEWQMKYAHDEINYSNIPVQKEMWFDTVVEVWVEVSGITGFLPSLQFGFDVNKPNRVEVNGIQVNLTSGTTYDFTAVGKYLFRISLCDNTTLTFQATDITADLRFTKIDSNVLEILNIFDFNILGDYLPRKLRYWYKLTTLAIWTRTDPGLEMNHLFDALILLNRDVPGVLDTIDFTNSTPDPTGELLKDFLNSQGVTTITS